jgi:hypothetical protein
MRIGHKRLSNPTVFDEQAIPHPGSMSRAASVIVWFLGCALWVFVCTIGMSANMPEPRIAQALTQSVEPARSAARKMWREYEENERQHFVKWTLIAFVPPLLSLLGGVMMLGTSTRSATAGAVPISSDRSFRQTRSRQNANGRGNLGRERLCHFLHFGRNVLNRMTFTREPTR